jgi:hypothetical protein
MRSFYIYRNNQNGIRQMFIEVIKVRKKTISLIKRMKPDDQVLLFWQAKQPL